LSSACPKMFVNCNFKNQSKVRCFFRISKMSLPTHIRLIREISRSSIATVWEGYDEQLQRKVLVKSLHPQLARDEELRVRFEREARTVASLAHPNIVRIYELYSDEEQLSLVFEFVEGQTLRELLRAHKILPVSAVLAIAHEILSGLSAAHEKGIIHRDLKPENVLLSAQGELKITDFGWAMVRDLPRLTHEGGLPGTPAYMAPEQAAGEEVTPRTDLFALGLMLFEMLTGQTALKGKTWQECLQELVRYQPPRFSDYRDRISPEMERILERLLERNPARRFENAQAAHEALEGIARDWQFSLAPDTLREFLAQMIAESPSEVELTETIRVRRGGRYAVVITLVVLILAVLIVYNVTKPPPKPEPSAPMGTTEEMPAPAESVFIEKQSPDTSTLIDSSKYAEQGVIPPETTPESLKGARQKQVNVKPTSADTSTYALIPAVPETVRLWINTEPSSEIVLDKIRIGVPPLETRVTTGMHTVGFQVARFPVVPETTIALRRGQSRDSLFVDLYQYVGVIDTIVAQPWARIYVDGALVDSTPRAKSLFLTLNTKHIIRLENPDYPAWEREFRFKRGDPPRQIRVDLSKRR
jgi:serine/threonine protein kinase